MKPLSSVVRCLCSLMILLLPTLASGLASARLFAQEADPRIQAVEEGITRGVQVQGRDGERFTLRERMEAYDVPGISIAVLEGGRIVWAGGYGVMDVEAEGPVTAETLFQAASISKPVAATAALRLVEEGLLELDAPVNDYLKRWKIPENAFTLENPVTLRHLLTHTGGLTVHGFPGYALTDEVPSTVQVLDGADPANTGPIRVDTLPGSLWRYSGGGYTVMQLLLEDVTGMPFPRILREKVLDPVGMSLSSYEQPLPPARAGYAASSHLADGTGGDGQWHLYPEMAAAGLWTNPSELARLALEIQAAYHGETGRVLSPEMARAMLTPGIGDWGLGFGVQGEGDEARFSHGGSNYGFKAQFMAYMEGGRGAFIMTNGDRGSLLAREVLLAVAREFGWPQPRYTEVALAEVPEEILREIAGTYEVVGQGIPLVVEVMGDHLRATIAGSEIMDLHPVSESVYMDLVEGSRVQVERDEEGRVTALQVLGGGPRAVRVEG